MAKEFLEFTFKTESIPSVNKSYARDNEGGVYKTSKVKEFQRDLSAFAFYSTKKENYLFLEKLEIHLTFGVKNLNRDLDNMIKATLDALQGVCFKNDTQVYRLCVLKEKSFKDFEYIKVKISKVKG